VQVGPVRIVLQENQPRVAYCGIALGQVVAGYTGTQQRATHTCIGDPVNLARGRRRTPRWRGARS
jgi:class 3 adenylate cyclase